MLFFLIHTKLDQTGLSWFELATKVDADVILRCEYNVPK